MAGRVPSCRPAELVRRLLRAGFRVDHQTGSHQVLLNAVGIRVVVPRHAREMKRGLLMGILKQAGIKPERFAAL
jgi:mRNA interferase HicA